MADDTISPVWSQQGWFEEATTWIQEQLQHLHYTITSDIKQVYVSPTSCVLCVATTYGDIYFEEHAKAEFRDATPYWLRFFLHNGEEFEEDIA